MLLFGTHDAYQPYNGGEVLQKKINKTYNTLSAEDIVKEWRIRNNSCRAVEHTIYADLDKEDKSNIESFRYGSRENRVIFLKSNGGSHSMPGIVRRYSQHRESVVGLQNHDIDLAEHAWRFFKEYLR